MHNTSVVTLELLNPLHERITQEDETNASSAAAVTTRNFMIFYVEGLGGMGNSPPIKL